MSHLKILCTFFFFYPFSVAGCKEFISKCWHSFSTVFCFSTELGVIDYRLLRGHCILVYQTTFKYLIIHNGITILTSSPQGSIISKLTNTINLCGILHFLMPKTSNIFHKDHFAIQTSDLSLFSA